MNYRYGNMGEVLFKACEVNNVSEVRRLLAEERINANYEDNVRN